MIKGGEEFNSGKGKQEDVKVTAKDKSLGDLLINREIRRIGHDAQKIILRCRQCDDKRFFENRRIFRISRLYDQRRRRI
jgi:hypothetical protein